MVWTTPRTWSDGELENAAVFNTHVRDNLEAIGQHVRIRKNTTESLVSSTTLQDDDELLWAVEINTKWAFEIYLRYNSGTTPDIKTAFSIPAGVSGAVTRIHVTGGALTMTESSALTTVVASDGTGGAASILMTGTLICGGVSPGNVVLQWAQNTSDAGSTQVLLGSHLIAHRIA